MKHREVRGPASVDAALGRFRADPSSSSLDLAGGSQTGLPNWRLHVASNAPGEVKVWRGLGEGRERGRKTRSMCSFLTDRTPSTGLDCKSTPSSSCPRAVAIAIGLLIMADLAAGCQTSKGCVHFGVSGDDSLAEVGVRGLAVYKCLWYSYLYSEKHIPKM